MRASLTDIQEASFDLPKHGSFRNGDIAVEIVDEPNHIHNPRSTLLERSNGRMNLKRKQVPVKTLDIEEKP